MKRLIKLAAVVVVLAMAVSASATTTVPRNTVIPLVLDNQVSSKTSRVGDQFYSHCAGPNCGGFPSGTTFVGVITETRPMKPGYPGQLNAKWTQAILPNGTKVAIDGVLAKGPVQGQKAKKGTKKTGSIIGGAVGLVAGGFGGLMTGGRVGHGAGAIAQGKTTDVTAKPGTKYNIVLTQPATIPTQQ